MNKLEGIVVSYSDYKDNDRIIKVLSIDNTLISFYCRGVRSIKSVNRSKIELLNRVLIEYEHKDFKELQLLRRLDVLDYYLELKSDLDKISIVNVMVEIISKAEMVNYQLFYQYLKMINDNDNVLYYGSKFFALLSSEYGVSLNLDSCIYCDNKPSKYISIQAGGLVCEDHISNHDDVIIVDVSCLNKLINSDEIILVNYEIFNLLVSNIVYRLDVNLNSLKFSDALYSNH